MIYSRSAEYAIRAFVHLATVPEGKYAMVKQIAERADIPSHFLAKILQQLARKGFLRSSKGPTGGFSLRMPAAEVSLLQIVDSVDGLADYERCPAGMAECNDMAPCGMHDSWKALRGRIMEYLERTTIEDLAKSFEQKRRNLEKMRKPKRSSKKS
jgi:Rrf2 family protein